MAPAPTHPRPTLPLAAQVAPLAIAVPELTRLDAPEGVRQRGTLRGEGEIVEFELWRERADGLAHRPLVLLVPILAGGSALMEMVAGGMFERGFDVAYCKRVGSAMVEGQRGPELQELFRRTVVHQRLLLAWLRSPEGMPPPATFVLGISLGGMIATVVAAHEPELAGIAICLSGGDMQSLVPVSDESRVRRWVKWRQEADGVGIDHLRWELREYLQFDPLRLGMAVPTDKVLFVSARYDAVVPPHNQDLLWEALGRPTRLTVPLGHYTAALAIAPILTAAARHFAPRVPAIVATEP